MRCLIITGGTVRDLRWLAGMLQKEDRVICVDGGARYAAALGVVPDVIVGDMDSVTPEQLNYFSGRGAMIKEYPADKNDTDTALALAEALSGSPEEIVVLGALGSRWDHSLANVHLLRVALDRGVKARIIDEHNEISLVAPHTPVVLEGKPGDLFSLLPLTEEVTGVNVRGAGWPLENAVFRIGNPYGISNSLASDRVEISIATGIVLLFRLRGAE